MEYHVRIAGPLPAFNAIDDAIRDADPAALVDTDAAAGHPVTLDQVRQLPSICCGGCSG